MKPVIVLNLKAYMESTGDAALRLCEIASEVSLVSGVRIIVAPQAVDLRACARVCEVFAQHSDAMDAGAFTGSITPNALKDANALGSLLNHSEKRMPHETIGKTVAALREAGLQSIVCSKDDEESAQVAAFAPDFIAVEPPELIGSGISVSNAKSQVVIKSVEAVQRVAKVPVLCGAGISNAEDVKKAIGLGANGVLLASAYVKSEDPKKLLAEMAGAMG